MTETKIDLSVAETIAQQIGRRAFQMMGTRQKIGAARSLLFDVHGCPRFSKIRITLEADDTYTVDAFKIRKLAIVRHEARRMVYAENLNSVIESITGLILSL